MFTYFFSLVIIIFEAICCNLFYDVFCKENSRLRKSQKVLLMLSLICCYYLCGLFLSDMLILKMTLVVLAAVIIMSFYFEISIKKSVIFALLYQGLSIIVDYIAYISNNTIISKAGEVQKGYALEGSLVVIFSKITVFLCILLLKKHFGKKSTETLPDKIWGRFLFFPVFTIITIIAMIMTFQYTKNEVQANVLYSISLGLAVMNIFVYFLINDIVTSEAKLHEKEILGLQFKNQIDMYCSISENYEIQKKKSHEFKNHILCIESLLKAHEYDKASKYVGNISDTFIGEKNIINTNHVIINAILNTKYQEAISKNIVFVFKVNDLSKTVIEDEDLVVAFLDMVENHKMIVENSGLLTVAALKQLNVKDKRIVSILSGGNMDVITMSSVVQQGLILRDRIFTVSVLLPDKPGELCRVSGIIAGVNGNVIKLEHNQFVSINRSAAVELRITLEAFGTEHKKEIIAALEKEGYQPKVVRANI